MITFSLSSVATSVILLKAYFTSKLRYLKKNLTFNFLYCIINLQVSGIFNFKIGEDYGKV